MRGVLILLLLLCGRAGAVELLGPDGPIEPKEYVQISVVGIPADDLPKAKVDLSPTDSVTLIAARSWTGEPFLFFRATKPGEYTVTVTVNRWRQSLEVAVSDAQAAKVPAADLQRIESLNSELANTYPIHVGSCVVEVRGQDDNPPGPDPPPPPPGKRWVVVIRESSQQTPQQAEMFRKWRADGTQPMSVLDPQDQDENGQPSKLVQDYLEVLKQRNQTPPAVLLVSPDGQVLYVGGLPAGFDELEKVVEENGG